MQINLSMENCWGIVRALVDVVAAMDDGKYLLVKCAARRCKSPPRALLRVAWFGADVWLLPRYLCFYCCALEPIEVYDQPRTAKCTVRA